MWLFTFIYSQDFVTGTRYMPLLINVDDSLMPNSFQNSQCFNACRRFQTNNLFSLTSTCDSAIQSLILVNNCVKYLHSSIYEEDMPRTLTLHNCFDMNYADNIQYRDYEHS
jgi:hypothetical protein